MNFNNIVLIVNILIGLFLLIGFVWGLARGAFKSFLRLSFLIFNCIFWLLVTPNISAFILNSNLSSLFTITIGGQTFTSLSALIDYFLNTNPTILELFSNSTILASFIDKVPMILMNFIVFISGYFLLKSITFPIYAYLANKAIALINKKNKQKWFATNKNVKNRFVGAFFGLIQGALTGMILFLPLSTLSLAFNVSSESNILANYSNLSISQSLLQNSSSENKVSVASSNSNQVDEFLNIYYNTFLGNTLKLMNLSKLNEFIFNELSSIEVDGVTISLTEEIKSATNIITRANNLLSEYNIVNLNDVTSTQWIKLVGTVNYAEVEKIVDDLFSLKLLDVMSEDVMPLIYGMFNDNVANLEEVLSSLPKDTNKILTYFLNSIKSGDTKTLKQDFLNALDILKTLQEHNMLGFVKNTGLLTRMQEAINTSNDDNIAAVTKEILIYSVENLASYSELEIKKEIVSNIFKSQTIRTLMPNIMNIIITSLNNRLDINLSTANTTRVSWSNEISKLASVIYNANKSAYQLMPMFKSTSPIEFNAKTLTDLPLASLGTLLNALRESQLFKDVYYNIIPQLLQKNITLKETAPNFNFNFINLETIDWQKELTILQQISAAMLEEIEKMNFKTLNTSEVCFSVLQENIVKIFDSTLIKEVLCQSSHILPYQLVEYFRTYKIADAIPNLVDNLAIILQEMKADELKNDIMLLLNATEQMSSITGKTLEERFLNASESQINIVLKNILNSNIGTALFPQILNLVISKMNISLNTTFTIDETFALSNKEIAVLTSAIYNLKIVYNEYNSIKEELDFTNLSSLSNLTQIEIEKVGTAIDLLKTIPTFNTIINTSLKETVFNYEKITKLLPKEFLTYFNVANDEINTISWFSEFSMVKTALPIAMSFVEAPSHTYPSVRVDTFLAQYGNSTFLKLVTVNGLLYLFPDADVNIIKQFNFVEGANNINGIMELVLLILDFKYNGLVEIPAMQEYRIREAIKTVNTNDNLKALIQNLSQISGLEFNELSHVVDIICDAIRGYEFSINDLAPYIDGVKLIPWIVDIAERFSKGYKTPYCFNIYMTVIGKKIELYSIHLGKMQATDSDGVKKEINVDEITKIVSYLAYVPNFVTAQFIFDSAFDITPDSMK